MPVWLDVALPFVARWEGCARRSKDGLVYPYLDRLAVPPRWTRGYGRTYGITGESPAITQEEARAELAVGLKSYAARVLPLAPGLGRYDGAFAAVVSWSWNCGIGAFRRSRLRRAVNDGRWGDAAVLIQKPRTAGGIEYPGLCRRRDAEAFIFRASVGI